MPSISIIIPAHNEEKRIGKTLEEYGKFFERKRKSKEIKNFEIIVVLNACKDRTIDVARRAEKKWKRIRHLDFEKGGKGFAVIEGFKEALKGKSNFIGIGFVDADMATSPEAFYELIKNIKDYDGIIASRYVKGAVVNPKPSIQRIIVSRVFNFLIRALYFMPYKDTQCLSKFSEAFLIIDGKPIKENMNEIKNQLKLSLIQKGKDFELYNVKNNVKIPSLNKKTKKIELARVSGFVIRRDKKRLLRIKIDGGRTFSVSENHPLIIYDGNKFYEKSASNLREGDLLPLVKNWDLNTDIDYLDIIDYIKENVKLEDIKVCNWKEVMDIKPSEISKKLNIPFDEAYLWYLRNRMPINHYLVLEQNKNVRNRLRLCFSGGKHTIPARLKITNQLMRLVGYYVAEGCCNLFDSKSRSRHSLRISFNKNESVFINETKKLLYSLFDIKPRLENQKSCTIVKAYSKILCCLFKEILKTGTNASNKRVPDFIYCLNKEKIGNFIDTYFLGDGNISLHKQANSVTIRANSSSEKLIKDLQLLLLRLGISSNIRYNTREKTIMGREIKDLKLRWNLSVHAGTNIKKFERYCPLIKRIHHNLFSKFKNRNPSIYERESRDIKNSDICLAKIKKIDITKYSGEWYDFKVQSDNKPYENFMHDCGILSHNCGAKIFKKEAIESILPSLGLTQWAFDVDLLYQLRKRRFKIGEFPTVWMDKKYSKLNFIKVSPRMAISIIRLRIIHSPFGFIARIYDRLPEWIKIHHRIK